MSKAVGLEIHARGVRAVEIAGRGKSFRVLRYIETSVPSLGGAPDPEGLREALSGIFKDAKFSRNSVISSEEAHETDVREIPVPYKSDDQIRKVVKYEAEHHLHDCDAEDVIVQYARVGESAEGTNLLVFAARKGDIGRRIEYARGSGVEPLAMDLDALAFYNAVRTSGALEDSPDCVLLNVAHRSTEMVFVQDGAVRALRSVRMGVDSIAQGLARDMHIELFEALSKMDELSEDEGRDDLFVPADGGSFDDGRRETEKSHAELERDLFHQKRDEFVSRLKREFVRSSAALRSTDHDTPIIATGPGVKVPGLIDLLSQRLGRTIEVFQPSQVFQCKLNGTAAADFDAGSAVALGLALKGIGNDPLGIDFRQEELKVANKFELLKTTLAITVTLLFLGLMASSFYFVYKRTTLAEQRFEPLVLKAFQSFATVAGKYNSLGDNLIESRYRVDPSQVESSGPRPEAIDRFVRELRKMRRKLQGIVGDDEGLPAITSALSFWNEIFGAVTSIHKELD